IMLVDTAQWSIARDFRATRLGPVWALGFSPGGDNVLAAGLESVVYSWPRDAMDAHGPMSDAAPAFLRDPAEMSNGERQFARKCSICHTLTGDSARRAGPSLEGLFGRAAGTVADYRYSDTLRHADLVWTPETVDALFAEGPDNFIPGSKMPMQRIAAARDRRDLIDYLRDATIPDEGD
ncbi:c-type cytochrome, partial [Thiohalocapsa sp.]|uniref:c-type cytochrome n=1 Tax=Thiohalocapsa sp. TaxID=2497641 RepID=UPI0025F65802